MPLFCKIPLVITAIQYTGTLASAVECGCDDPSKPDVILEKDGDVLTGRLIIATKEGPLVAQSGDWVITGIEGERYPCKPSIFEKTYVPVTAGTSTPAEPFKREEYLRHLEAGVKQLADYIIENMPGEPCENEGAIDTAMRLLGRLTEVKPPPITLNAQGLYHAYCASSDWKNFRGDPCPKWDDLPEAIRTHWQAVRDAA